jgi:hypothetical protein
MEDGGAPGMITDTGSVFANSDYGDDVLTPASTSPAGQDFGGDSRLGTSHCLGGGDGMYNHQITSMPSAAKKPDEPYASLLYRAFMSHPRHAMTLQEVYQWFRDNTGKDDLSSKGWQNSIRHNLSMNGVNAPLPSLSPNTPFPAKHK